MEIHDQQKIDKYINKNMFIVVLYGHSGSQAHTCEPLKRDDSVSLFGHDYKLYSIM